MGKQVHVAGDHWYTPAVIACWHLHGKLSFEFEFNIYHILMGLLSARGCFLSTNEMARAGEWTTTMVVVIKDLGSGKVGADTGRQEV